MTIALRDYVLDQAGNSKAGLTVDLWEAGAGALTSTTTTDANGLWSFTGVDETKTWRVKITDGTKVIWRDARAKIQLTSLDMITDINVDTINEHTSGSGVTIDGLLIKDGSTTALDYGLSFQAIVTTYTDTTHFKASGLTGKGNDFFNGYYAYVVWDAGGAGAAPQGEAVAISDYVSSDGTFTHTAFTAALATTDEVLIIHPYLWYLLELKSTNIPADVDTLLTRLSAARAGYLDNLSAGAVAQAATALSTATWTGTRAGYLDNLSGGAVALAASWTSALATALGSYTAARAGYLDELAAANIPADVDTLLTRLTALRAGYLDNLSAGAVALNSTVAKTTELLSAGTNDFNATSKASINTEVDSALNTIAPLTPTAGALLDILSKAAGGNTFNKTTDSLEAIADSMALAATALSTATWTATRAGYLDNLSAGAVALASTALSTATWTGTRAGYLDNLSGGAAALQASLISQGTTDFNATAKASINTEVDSALNTIVPASPTAGSLNDILSKAAGANTFNKATDSLEGIADSMALAATALSTATWTGTRAGYLDNLSAGAVALASTALSTATWTGTRAGYLDNLSGGAVALASVATETRLAELDAANLPTDVSAILADTGTDGVVVNSRSTAGGRLVGLTQVLEVSVTSAANAGAVTLATVTTQPCLIKSIVVHADTAAQTDLTSAAVAGGASGVVVFLSATDAAKANIDAVDEQVAWTGAARLAATKTIVMTLAGTGATAVDLTVTIEYESCVAGGYLA